MDMDMGDMVMVTGDADGGVPLFIIRHAGADGTEAQGLTGFTEIIFMCITTSM
jgi:hypothetical protein